jgi:uncharacterized protein YwgA
MKLSKPELIALLLYVPGQTGKIGEEIRGKTRLMKLIFLLAKEAGLEEVIAEKTAFKPYKYGPFDIEVYDALEALKSLGIVEEKRLTETEVETAETFDEEVYDTETIYKLTLSGIAKVKRIANEIPADLIRVISNYKTIYGNKPLVEILHYVYNKYPEYAKVSEAKI